MNIEKYTERARGFIQSAQSLVVRDGHQQFSPLHMLKVLLDDSEGLAGGLIDRAGGNSRAILKATEDALNKLPKVSGSGAGQVYLAPNWRARSMRRRKPPKGPATASSPWSGCCSGLRSRRAARLRPS
jgi:ATP-dependent Clp protease ATP-binding subunit ClpA